MPSNGMAMESSCEDRPQNQLGRGNMEWTSSTTLTFRNDSTHVCTGSVTICEENRLGGNKDVSISTHLFPSNAAEIKNLNQGTSNKEDGQGDQRKDSGIPFYRTQISLENFTPQKTKVDESDGGKFHGSGSSMKLMKLKETATSIGKDNVLARRMAARIKFILQVI